DAMRPCLLNGIEDLATRPDLLERSILLRLPTIEEDQRRTEEEFWANFEAARPRILGALLDAAEGALENEPEVRLPTRPRMADFAIWATAVGMSLGWPDGAFMKAYTHSQEDANESALEAYSFVAPLLKLAVQQAEWRGTASALL